MRQICFTLITLMGMAALPIQAKTLTQSLDNGLKVIIKEDHRAPVAVSQIWYRVGSVDELNGTTGLSHALEHLMFKGTDSVPAGEFSRLVAATGGQFNAFTSQDQTVYYETTAASALPEMLRLEADRMANLNFSNDAFKNEMEVIKEERRMRTDDTPGGVLWEGLLSNAFVASPSRLPVIGWMNDLDNMQAEDLRDWYKQWYAPNNATVIVVGDVNAEETLAVIKREFGGFKPQTLPVRKPQIEPTQKGIKRVQVSAPSELPILALAYKAPKLIKLDDKKPYALAMLAAVLDGHEASRLSKKLVREDKIALSVSAGYDLFNRGASLFTLTAMPTQGQDLAKLEQALKDVVADIATQGVSEAELKRIRNQMDASDVYKKDSMEGQALSMGYLEMVGFGHEAEERMKKNMQKVTSKEIQAAAQSLVDDQLTVVTLKPEPINPAKKP
ncbi:MAG: insulinase family protein [Neisseriaceae bacterium]|nr:insulinase family protein [Neisseriaceae bacterium]